MAFPPDEHRNLNAFDPASWIAGISAALIAAGARRVRSLRPSTVSFEWPVASGDKPQSALPLEIEHQEGGTLVLVKQGAWRLSVTEANRRLVALMAQQLRDRRSRGDNGLINIQWQHTPAYQTDVPVSVDDFVQMDTADWLERLLASVRRHEQLFTVLDPLVQQAAAGVFEPGRAHVVVHALAMRLAEPASAAAVAFDPASWSGVAGTALTAAGAQHVLPRPTAISLEWPVVPPVRRVDDDESGSIPLEVQQQDGGTLIVVALFAWRMSVTDANKRLVELIARELCHASHRADNGFLDINWQYNDEGQRDAPFSLDDYVHAETLDWVDRLLASARRLEQIFRALDPLVQQAAAGVLDSGRAHVVVRDLAERLSGRSSAEAGGLTRPFPRSPWSASTTACCAPSSSTPPPRWRWRRSTIRCSPPSTRSACTSKPTPSRTGSLARWHCRAACRPSTSLPSMQTSQPWCVRCSRPFKTARTSRSSSTTKSGFATSSLQES